MKIDIHNHILPKNWPDLDKVGLCCDNPLADIARSVVADVAISAFVC